MMNSSKEFLKDVTNIFSSVPQTGKLIIRTIAAKSALKFRFAQLVSIPTNQIDRRAAIARRGDMVSLNVLHDSRQIS